MQCRYCKRDKLAPCRSTRDMDEANGFNRDPQCHAALARLGGGEQPVIRYSRIAAQKSETPK